MDSYMRYFRVPLLSTVLFLVCCAQIPKESIELSVTVGRDLAIMERSHKKLVEIYYENLINQINDFVDNVYLPYQIKKTLSDEAIKKDILLTIESASRDDSTEQSKKDAFMKIKYLHLVISEEVEKYRREKLGPVKTQYNSVVDGIDASYRQIHYANSIVTGHLASIVKVHDTQNEILEKIDIKNIGSRVGSNISAVSDEISELIAKSGAREKDFDKLLTRFEELADSLR
jgi:hypothetical protein